MDTSDLAIIVDSIPLPQSSPGRECTQESTVYTPEAGYQTQLVESPLIEDAPEDDGWPVPVLISSDFAGHGGNYNPPIFLMREDTVTRVRSFAEDWQKILRQKGITEHDRYFMQSMLIPNWRIK